MIFTYALCFFPQLTHVFSDTILILFVIQQKKTSHFYQQCLEFIDLTSRRHAVRHHCLESRQLQLCLTLALFPYKHIPSPINFLFAQQKTTSTFWLELTKLWLKIISNNMKIRWCLYVFFLIKSRKLLDRFIYMRSKLGDIPRRTNIHIPTSV